MYNAYIPKGGFAVTPSDTTQLGSPIPTQLYIGSAGSLVIVTEDGSTLTYPVIQAGTILWMRVAQVKATGTTATQIIAHY